MRKGIGGHTSPNRGATVTWLTPPGIIEALGPFDLDPATPEFMPWETARNRFTELDNGLMMPWYGRVWLNPPYDRDIALWLGKLADHGNGIALIFARTETEAFHREVWQKADGLFFFEGRLFFHDGKGVQSKMNAGGPSVLIAYGSSNADRLESFKAYRGRFIRLSDATLIP